ncbi:hypothetical protein [Actinoplanes sp. NPDC026670]|uniref:DUF6197 family protein n=1 Tax=Actinoplanes sp. NPDC026670 TaxID=3154700 RepID=UPI0033FCB796
MNRTQNPTGTAADTTTDLVVTPALILRGAANYLELHGWIRGDYYGTVRPFPPADAGGALGMAAHGAVTTCPFLDGPHVRDCNRAYRYLCDYLTLRDELPVTGPVVEGLTLSFWNDDPWQTVDNVIASLRAAADEYDWTHASEDDLETFAENELDNDRIPTRAGFLAWLAGRR